MRPRPSFWLGCFGNSLTLPSWGSIPNLVDPMQRRVLGVAMPGLLSLAPAHPGGTRSDESIRCRDDIKAWASMTPNGHDVFGSVPMTAHDLGRALLLHARVFGSP
jgi:hypothetical protein